jgi:DNA gyrase subunit B
LAQFKDDKMNIIERDIDKIIARPMQYISALGDLGVFHICKEIVDNAWDECRKKESPADTIKVTIREKSITVVDNGRGIPTDTIQKVFETIQAGSNMERAGGYTAGENGVGTTCAVAMASELVAMTIRPSEKKTLTLRYQNGRLVDREEEKYTGKDHGMVVTFSPSKKLMGTDKIPIDMLKNWFKDFDYTLPRGIKMEYTIGRETFKVEHKTIDEFFDIDIKKEHRFCSPLRFKCSGGLKETYRDKEYDRTFEIDAAIVYSSGDYRGELIEHSWMNHIHTTQNGSHVNGIVNGFIKYMTEKVVAKNKKLVDEDLKKDILAHFNIVVKGECNMAHMFSSQAKHTVNSQQLGIAIRNAAYESLKNMNQRVIDDMVDVIIANHRARIEGEKARDINRSTKEIKTWTIPDSFIPCANVKTEQPKEIFLVEGNSAGGGIRGGRNGKFQAILMFKGKSLNVWDNDLDRVLKSEPWLNLVKILGCGIGSGFDIKKLKYDKIIIATDADVDGYHIRVGFITFFVKYMPDIIRAGKLYIAEPPLYKLQRGKDVSYVATRREYMDKCIESLGDLEIEFPA